MILLALERAASAAIINVPGDAATIQAGINAASNGDVVQVAAGTYTESINFDGKAIKVASTGGPQVTTINGGAAGPVVTFKSGEGALSVIAGFTITNGFNSPGETEFGEGGGILIENSSPTVISNIVTGNFAGVGGGGIAILNGSPTVQSNTITGNSQKGGSGGVGGGGIELGGTGNATVVSNTISNNSWPSGDGGGLRIFSPGNALIASNTISNNSWASGNGGGIALDSAGTPTLVNNLISDNLATGVYGCDAILPCTPNDAEAGGGGISIVSTAATLIQNLIVNNDSDIGGGVFLDDFAGSENVLMVNNTIAGNQITTGYGSAILAYGFGAGTSLINNILVAAGSQNAFYCASGDPLLKNNDVFSAGGVSYKGDCPAVAGVSGNISANPLFVNTGSNAYGLLASSPAIDAGANSVADLRGQDFYGNPRIVAAHSGCGAPLVDMGIAEYQGTESGSCPGAPPKAPKLKVSALALAFVKTPQFSTRAAKKLLITNPRRNPATAIVLASYGPFASDFNINNKCPAQLNQAATCSLSVTFTPSSTTKESAEAIILNASDAAIAVVKLSGTGASTSRR